MNSFSFSIVDNDVLIAELLNYYCENSKQLNLLNSFTDGNLFIDYLKSGTEVPDVVIIELKLTTIKVVDLIAFLQNEYPNVKIIVMTSVYKPEFIGSLFRAGVNAFISKSISVTYLIDILKEVNEKGFYFTEEQLDIMKNQISSKVPKPIVNDNEKLTDREIEVLDLICKQYTTNDIAERLFITKRTVEGHRSNLLLKSCTKNTVGLVIWAMQNSILDFNKYEVFY
ncbi:MAG: response regulator transcription factor [Bacteroidales bacterium]|jgi:DNA-binding NarL/FixJ family response regulator|nr:response regulator transcription factor [Bacteroidales bacterium]